MKFKKAWSILKGTFSEFGEDKVIRLSAALAYYAMFSIGPLLVIAAGLAGLAFGHESVRKQIDQQLRSMVGEQSTQTLDSMMSAQTHTTSVITTIIGIIALLFGAGGVFGQLQDSLNTIWEVTSKPGTGIWGFIRARFLSLTMVLGTGFLLLISMALTTFLTAVGGSLGNKFGFSEVVAHVLNFAVSFAVITVLFAMIFKFLPDVRIPFRKVWVGAIVTALLFTGGKYLLALYLGRESTTSSYGAAGSVIIILMWVYYASLILFFGAEFTQVYARQTGAKIVPKKYAVPVTEEQRAEQGIPEQHHPAEHPSAQPACMLAQSQSRGPDREHRRVSRPGTVGRLEPRQILPLAIAAGFMGGLLVRFKWLRKAVRVYWASGKSQKKPST